MSNYNELNGGSPVSSRGGQKIRWKKSGSNKLFHQIICEDFHTVQSEQLGLLNVKCTGLENDLPNKEIVLSPTHNLGQIQGLKLHFNHSLHNSGIGNGEDVLQGILTLKNESSEPVKCNVSFITSAQPHKNAEEQKIYIPISAAGLFRDERLAELGSMNFLQECEQKIGKNKFSCHYLEPALSNPEIQSTKALLLAPVVDIQHPSSPWRIALFTPSEEPYQFSTTTDEKGNMGWLAERQIEVSPGSSKELNCYLFCHKGEADVAWDVFHQIAHKEEFDTPDWLHNVKVHYFDFLSSADGETGIRGDGYDADLPNFKEFKVGLATQHGYYPYIGDFIHPDRKTWKAMQGSPYGPATMSIQIMKDRVSATRKTGARVGIYLHTVLFDDGSPLFSLFENSILVGIDGQKKKFDWKADDTASQNWWMSLASEDWTNHLLKQAEYIMEILNPDAIVVDETFLCLGYDHHPERQGALSKYGIEFFKQLRRLVHSYGNDKAVLTSDCGMSNMVMWADGEAGDHAYPTLLGHPLYRKEPVRFKAALGQKTWIPCAWNFKKLWKEQMDLARKLRMAVGVSNGWEEYTGLNGLDATTRSRLLKDIESLKLKKNSMFKINFLLTIFLFATFSIHAQTYKNADLPYAMTFLDGSKVKTKADWEKRKTEIKNLWCDYFIGHHPKEVPELLSAEVVKTEKNEDGSTRKRVVLTFDTPNKKSFEIEVWEPKEMDNNSRPLFLTQPRYYQFQWAEEAVKRGYIACLYPGLDAHHTEEDYPGYQNIWKVFKDEYPNVGWASSLGIEAWLASRTLDYLLDKESGYNIDTTAVGISGHSRYGKQSIYAAAFDERFKTVIARSSGSPTGCSYRFSSRQTFMESVADFPDVWAKASLKDFLGRENELPIEGNALMATIAPRNLMIHTAYNDGSDPTFGVERNYVNAKKVYTFLGAKNNIYLSYREGQHNPITEAHTKHMFDYFDMTFGRGTLTREDFPEILHHQFDFEAWKSKQRRKDLELGNSKTLEEKINWMLGEKPDNITTDGEYHLKTEEELGVPAWSRDRWNPGGLKRVPFTFSRNMNGNIYFDPKLKSYKGTVIWLHPWNYSHGSNEGYGVQETTIYWRLAQEGYVVVGYDQFGFGDQITRAFGFYEKYPHWSLLGRAVSDVSHVIDYLEEGKGIAEEEVPETDPSKIYICGFSYGGMVGLYAAALDERITGVASFSGFTPMRTDTDKKPTGGIRRLWEWHHVMPKLGLYNNKEAKIPYDYDDVIQMIAPRNVLIYAPLRDRFTDQDDIRNCVEKAQTAWANNKNFEFKNPDDICRFQKDQQDVVLEWLNKFGE